MKIRPDVRLSQITQWLICFVLVLAMQPEASAKQSVEQQYRKWVQSELWPLAKKRGIRQASFTKTMKATRLELKLPDLITPGTKPKPSRPQTQSEFRSPAPYFSEKRIQSLVAAGRRLAKKHARTLKKIERKYGVPGRIILAIWGRESAFGKAKIPHNAMNILATRAFMSRRKALFQKELLAALVMLDKGLVSTKQMKSSWAGALGQPQFLPSSYLEHAVDFDGDGFANIWTSVPDSLASIANYLKNFGWEKNRDWGYEAKIPAKVSCALEGPDQMKPLSHWSGLGVTRISGKGFPKKELKKQAAILMPAGRQGPVFMATPNFYVIKKYNNSDLYGLFVGKVADRIQWGGTSFKAGWAKSPGLKRGNVMAIQNALIKQGYDVGGADGLAGFKTRRSIGDWQQKNGSKPTCWPNKSLAKVLK